MEGHDRKSAQPSRTVRRYLERERAHGKSAFARVFDACVLLLVVFAAVWLYLYGKGVHADHAFLLATITALFLAVMHRMVSAFQMRRFAPRQMRRIAKELLRCRIPFFDPSDLRSLCKKAANADEPIVFCSAEAVGADRLLPYLCAETTSRQVFCCAAGFTETAQKLVAGHRPTAKLIGAEPLLEAALDDPQLCPSLEDVYRFIEAREAARKQRRRRASAFPMGGSTKRYLIAAGLLLLFSYRTGYALYYRMLASLCLSAAMLRGLLTRSAHTEPVA